MLELKGLTKLYGESTVLSSVNLEVGNEIKALIGINGSGKSTLLKIAAGTIEPDKGSVLVDGREVTKLPPEQRNIGYVPQRPALFTHLSVEENIRYGMRNGRGTEKACTEAIEMLGLSEVLSKKPRQLSGGYQHRTSLARAIVTQPGILLLDEPLNGMDVVLKRSLLPEFKEVLKILGVPVLFVTHDLKEAELIADDMVALVNGQISSFDSSDQMFY